VLERVHGHLGWLAVAALLHPAILLRTPRRRAPLSVLLATGLVLCTAALGASFYPEYRSRLKQHIFIEKPWLGWLFERKEHLAVGVVVFAIIGCVAHLAERTFQDPGSRRAVARLAHRSFLVAFGLSVLAAAFGVAVASYKSF